MNIGTRIIRRWSIVASASQPIHHSRCLPAIQVPYVSSRNASTSTEQTAVLPRPLKLKRSRRTLPRKPSRSRKVQKKADAAGKEDLLDVMGALRDMPNESNIPSSSSDSAFAESGSFSSFRRLPPPHFQETPLEGDLHTVEGVLEPSDDPVLQDVKPMQQHNAVGRLAHGLDRVLFNPGVHWLQDPHSRVYNFPPYLETIPKVTDFAFERLRGFVKSSRDQELWALARQENRKFAGSTSSLSGMLSHIYFLLSGDREVNTDNLSRHFGKEPRTFTEGQRMPVTVVFNHDGGVYAIDSYKDEEMDADKNILTWMGTLLEKYLTVSPDAFRRYMRSDPGSSLQKNELRDAYRFSKSKDFVMRSQLDCHDPRLPGTGVFDIKTRACLPIRMDLLNFEENSGYLIRSQTGKVESFEREYYDLIRSAFLKYSFQARIGNMDGVMVAYHNTARLFGFQYIPISEMDTALFGTGKGTGDRVFEKCIGILEQVANEIVACYPGKSVKCTFEKQAYKDAMNVWVEPVEGEGSSIRQLTVTVSNMLNGDPVRGSTAINTSGSPWTTMWTINRLPLEDRDIRKDLQAALKRQFRYYDIPTGWDPDSVRQFWAGLNFGGQKQVGDVSYNPSYFRMPGPRVKSLRQLARDGKEESDRLMNIERGLAKVYLPTTIFDDGSESTTKVD